jgi:hypothetical protein
VGKLSERDKQRERRDKETESHAKRRTAITCHECDWIRERKGDREKKREVERGSERHRKRKTKKFPSSAVAPSMPSAHWAMPSTCRTGSPLTGCPTCQSPLDPPLPDTPGSKLSKCTGISQSSRAVNQEWPVIPTIKDRLHCTHSKNKILGSVTMGFRLLWSQYGVMRAHLAGVWGPHQPGSKGCHATPWPPAKTVLFLPSFGGLNGNQIFTKMCRAPAWWWDLWLCLHLSREWTPRSDISTFPLIPYDQPRLHPGFGGTGAYFNIL